MLTKLQIFFDRHLSEKTQDETPLEHRLQLATAALMVEMVHADEEISDQEELQLRELIEQRFQLSRTETEDLIQLASDEKHEATDYYAFTSLLNTHYSQSQRINLVQDLWQLAYADDQLDKYEEHLLRKLADLLHVPHQDFIRTKHQILKNKN